MSTQRRRILVTGLEGQVVQSLIERGQPHGDIEIVAIGRPQLDLSDPASIPETMTALAPDLIVSAAAYTAVDQAESEEVLATTINGTAAGALATVAATLGIPIIHLSTDYVFDGSKPTAYVETDPVGPIGAYGRSKLAGEIAVAAATDNHAILRTAWVHSPFGKNFVKTMLRVAESRPELNVVADQFGTPTSALDIADGVITVARNLLDSDADDLRGVFHLTNAGRASWADFAETIFAASAARGGPSAVVHRIPSSQYPTPARRPSNSHLAGEKLQAAHGIALPDWQSSAEVVVARLVAAA